MHQVSLFIFTSCIINAEITINGYSYFFFSFHLHLHSFALGGVVVVVVVVVPPVDVGGGWKVYGQHPIQRGTYQEKIFFELSADDVSKFQISNFRFSFYFYYQDYDHHHHHLLLHLHLLLRQLDSIIILFISLFNHSHRRILLVNFTLIFFLSFQLNTKNLLIQSDHHNFQMMTTCALSHTY